MDTHALMSWPKNWCQARSLLAYWLALPASQATETRIFPIGRWCCCILPRVVGRPKKLCFLYTFPDNFMLKIPTLKFFSTLQSPYQHKTCLRKRINYPPKKITFRPSLLFLDHCKKQTTFLGLSKAHDT